MVRALVCCRVTQYFPVAKDFGARSRWFLLARDPRRTKDWSPSIGLAVSSAIVKPSKVVVVEFPLHTNENAL